VRDAIRLKHYALSTEQSDVADKRRSKETGPVDDPLRLSCTQRPVVLDLHHNVHLPLPFLTVRDEAALSS